MRYEVDADGSAARTASVFHDMTDAPGEDAIDGIKVDQDGQRLRLRPRWRLDALARRASGSACSSCRRTRTTSRSAMTDGRTLYVTALTSVYRIRLGIPGIRPD